MTEYYLPNKSVHGPIVKWYVSGLYEYFFYYYKNNGLKKSYYWIYYLYLKWVLRFEKSEG